MVGYVLWHIYPCWLFYSIYIYIYIYLEYTRLKPVPAGVVSGVLIFWVIGEFRVFQHHTPLTRTTPSEMINF